MPATGGRLLAILLSCSLIACSSFQPIRGSGGSETDKVQRQALGVAVGDTVKVNPKGGESFEMVVSRVGDELISGTHNGQRKDVPISEIGSLERNRLDVMRTSLMVLGVMIVALGQYARGVGKLTNP